MKVAETDFIQEPWQWRGGGLRSGRVLTTSRSSGDSRPGSRGGVRVSGWQITARKPQGWGALDKLNQQDSC